MNAAGMAKQALLERTTEAERFRLLVEAVSDYAIYMLDTNGIVTSWNAGAERIKGYKAGEILGRSFANFYEEADRKAGVPQRVLAIAGRDGKFQAEGWRVRKDGTRFWAFVIIDAIYDRRRADRLRQDHARPHGATAGRGGAATQRGALPPAGRGRHRLRDLHARPQRHRQQLERRRRAHQGLRAGRDRRPSISRSSTPTRTAATASRRAAWRLPNAKAASRPRRGGSARTARASGPTW